MEKPKLSKALMAYAIPLSVITACIVFAQIWLLVRQQTEILDTELKAKGVQIAKSIAEKALIPVILQDTTSLGEIIIRVLQSEPDVTGIGFYNKEGTVITKHDAPTLLLNGDKERITSAINSSYPNTTYWGINIPIITTTNDCIGFAAINISRSRVEEVRQETLPRLLVIVSTSFLSIFILLLLLLRRVRALAKTEVINKLEIEKSRESNALKEAFLANMSHEIRTPLNAILGLSEILQNTPLTQEQQKYITSICASGKNLLVIVNDILDYSKLEAGKVSIESIGFKIENIIQSITSALEHKTIDKDLFLETQIEPRANRIVLGDPVRLGQILLNLTNNAIKFTERGHVLIKCSVKEEKHQTITLQFQIIDTGVGIESTKLEGVFNSFQQADSSTTRKFGGTGLGLSIVKNLVLLHNGEISAQSTLGEGSVFTVTITYPIGSEKDLKSQLTEKVEPKIQTEINVLLVEDNEMNQLLASTILESEGAIVTTANNGQEALDLLKIESYDVILMDVQMPVMGGIEATKNIREKLNLKVPIIALTANAMQGDREKFLASGMDDYLSKPFSKEVLMDKIIKLTGNQPNIKTVVEKASAENKKINNKKRYDLKMLYDIGKSEDFVDKSVVKFVKQAGEYMSKVKTQIDNADWEGVYQSTHYIKSTVGFMGIEALREKLQSAEQHCKDPSKVKDVPVLFETILPEFEEVTDELKKDFGL